MAKKNIRVDGDDLDDFLIDLHQSLGSRLSDEAYKNANTLGEISDAVWRQLPDEAQSGGKCPTSMCYYRLKAYFRMQHPKQPLGPHTRLSAIEAFSYHDLMRAFGDKGWQMPDRRAVSATWLSALAVGVITALLPLGNFSIGLGIPVFFFGLYGFHHVFTTGLPRAQTIGDLAREMRTRNLARLIDDGASLSRAEIWRLFAERDWDHNGPTTRNMSWLA